MGIIPRHKDHEARSPLLCTQSHVGIGLCNSSSVLAVCTNLASKDLILALPSTRLVTWSKLQSLSLSFFLWQNRDNNLYAVCLFGLL